jgi:peptidoglycan DL-endopeptidase CwlO
MVFFDALNHVGIYIGAGQFVHAPHTGDVVKITTLAAYGGGYVGARRI